MIKAIVTDIEGTTTSLSFVKNILFPYARDHLAEFVSSHQIQAELQQIIAEVVKEVGRELTLDEVIEQLIEWSDQDKKITPLKSVQGLLWEDGYRRGAFVRHLYPDVLPNLHQWHAKNIALYVYSSGSVYAQKLLFGHTVEGDVTSLFSGYFDTRIGAKRDLQAYVRIAEQLQCVPEQLLFLSDIKEELDPAKAAGFKTVWICRDSVLNPNAEHVQVASFDEIVLSCEA